MKVSYLILVGLSSIFISSECSGSPDASNTDNSSFINFQKAETAMQERNIPLAISLYNASCDSGYAKACTNLVDAYIVNEVMRGKVYKDKKTSISTL